MLDRDGNWMAQYTLLPSKQITIRAKGRIFIHLTPEQEVLSSSDKSLFLQQQPYWQTHDATIRDLADKLQTPENIYDYVRTHLTYDFSRVSQDQKRLGAAYVIAHPQSAVCLEFTDLFVALARAAGIPAREVDGFAYTQNTKERPTSQLNDILHAWPEYYDESRQTWIMVDPTWANTTGGVDYFHELDFDHVAFTIKGAESAYPIPAGGYKLVNGANGKDVHISFADSTKLSNPKASVDENIPDTAIAGFPMYGSVTIENTGSTLIPVQHLFVRTYDLLPTYQNLVVNAIPPFGSQIVPLSFSSHSLLTNKSSTVTIQFGSTPIKRSVAIVPFFLRTDILVGGAFIVILCIVLFVVTARPGSIPILGKKR